MSRTRPRNITPSRSACSREAGADMVTAITMTNANEASGVARAADAAGMPVAISFTVETDGRLPTGETLGDAIAAVDAATGRPGLLHDQLRPPDAFRHVLDAGAGWMGRIRGLRANASRRSHAELDDAPELDTGDPVELGGAICRARRRFPHINVLGGCCGTDHRHVDSIARPAAALLSRKFSGNRAALAPLLFPGRSHTCDPPPMKWSDSKYGFCPEEDWNGGRYTSRKRSLRSCVRLMF